MILIETSHVFKQYTIKNHLEELYSDLGRHSNQLALPVDRSRLPRIASKSRRKSLISETDVSSSSDTRILLIGGISKYEDELHTYNARKKSSFIRRDFVFSMDPLINSTVMTHTLPEARFFRVLFDNISDQFLELIIAVFSSKTEFTSSAAKESTKKC